ncbi:zinc finger and BTB domain-containing protein 43-like [Branchiostoma floridae]|uniref:Zinc finger and BTB domain-containing protein 43-like n=1 Tax=Branchiostoma floridae TaxID=7739 RepID=A0A9J7HKG9_BRAFL|nr:zinc finger and BTB domain-containing protein 43-like [Branchiostoma floridae]
MAEVITMVTERVSEYPALPTRLQQHLDLQRRAGQFCDVTLSVQDAKFNLHRCVLSAFSPHLTGMLNSAGPLEGAANNSGTAQATQLDLPELTREGVTPVVNFMYTSKLVLTRDNIFPVSVAAGYFQIRELIQECQQYFQETQQSQGQGLQGHFYPGGSSVRASPGTRVLPEQFQTVSGTRMVPEQHQATLGTRMPSLQQHHTTPGLRVSPEQHQAALGTRMLSQQHHTAPGTRMPSEQHHHTLLGTRMPSGRLQTTPGTRRSSGSTEVLSVDSSPGLQSPTSTSQQVYSGRNDQETGKNDQPGATAGHGSEDTLNTSANDETATDPANFPPADFRVESSDEFSGESHIEHSNINSEAVVVKQEPAESWMDFPEGAATNQQEMDSYMWRGGNHVSDDSDKPFQCMFCPKRLRSKSLLAMHIRRHTGERPHACPLCFTKFHEKWSLTKHMRVHTGEKPYKCTQCPATFADASNRNKHRKRMHGVYTQGSNSYATNSTPEREFEGFPGPVNHMDHVGMRANQLFSVPNTEESTDLDTQQTCVE